jgi:hypothetical protein
LSISCIRPNGKAGSTRRRIIPLFWRSG